MMLEAKYFLNAAFTISILVLILSSILVFSSLHVFTPLEASVSPVQPSLILGCYTGSIPHSITRANRGALVYTDFESTTGWNSNGGSWNLTTGYKGSGIQGTDNDGGLGGASQYYYNSALNVITGWVTVKTRLSNGTGWYGLAVLDQGRRAMYTVGINSSGYLTIYYYSREWLPLRDTSIPSYSFSSWYILVVSFSFTKKDANITVYLYDVSGVLLASVSYSGKNYMKAIPAYYGINVDGVTAVFDDFMVSTPTSDPRYNGDPRYIVFQGVPAGYSVSVYDTIGLLVNSTVSTGGDTLLGVVSDTVVGTGSGGGIIVSYPEGLPALNYTVPSTDALLGGDVYAVVAFGYPSCSLGANYTSASVSARISSSSSMISGAILLKLSNNDVKPVYARLILANYTAPSTLTVNITLKSGSYEASPPITISSGVVSSNMTGWIEIPSGSSIYLYAKGYFTASSQSATLNIYLEYCTMVSEGGSCVYNPVEVTLTG